MRKEWEYLNGKFVEIDSPLEEYNDEKHDSFYEYMESQGYRRESAIIGMDFDCIAQWCWNYSNKEVELFYPFILDCELWGVGYFIYIKELPDVLHFLKEHAVIFNGVSLRYIADRFNDMAWDMKRFFKYYSNEHDYPTHDSYETP